MSSLPHLYLLSAGDSSPQDPTMDFYGITYNLTNYDTDSALITPPPWDGIYASSIYPTNSGQIAATCTPTWVDEVDEKGIDMEITVENNSTVNWFPPGVVVRTGLQYDVASSENDGGLTHVWHGYNTFRQQAVTPTSGNGHKWAQAGYPNSWKMNCLGINNDNNIVMVSTDYGIRTRIMGWYYSNAAYIYFHTFQSHKQAGQNTTPSDVLIPGESRTWHVYLRVVNGTTLSDALDSLKPYETWIKAAYPYDGHPPRLNGRIHGYEMSGAYNPTTTTTLANAGYSNPRRWTSYNQNTKARIINDPDPYDVTPWINAEIQDKGQGAGIEPVTGWFEYLDKTIDYDLIKANGYKIVMMWAPSGYPSVQYVDFASSFWRNLPQNLKDTVDEIKQWEAARGLQVFMWAGRAVSSIQIPDGAWNAAAISPNENEVPYDTGTPLGNAETDSQLQAMQHPNVPAVNDTEIRQNFVMALPYISGIGLDAMEDTADGGIGNWVVPIIDRWRTPQELAEAPLKNFAAEHVGSDIAHSRIPPFYFWRITRPYDSDLVATDAVARTTSTSGSVDDTGATSTSFDTDLTGADGDYVGQYFYWVSPANNAIYGQLGKQVQSFTASTGTVTFATAWSEPINDNDAFIIGGNGQFTGKCPWLDRIYPGHQPWVGIRPSDCTKVGLTVEQGAEVIEAAGCVCVTMAWDLTSPPQTGYNEMTAIGDFSSDSFVELDTVISTPPKYGPFEASSETDFYGEVGTVGHAPVGLTEGEIGLSAEATPENATPDIGLAEASIKISSTATPVLVLTQGAADDLEEAILLHLSGKSTWAAPTIELALTFLETSEAVAYADVPEMTYTGYARQTATWEVDTAAGDFLMQNVTPASFPRNNGTTTQSALALAVLDSANSMVLTYNTFDEPIPISPGAVLLFTAEQIQVKLT